jgi:alkanesulfonate monooxygenase SsuD/methylene tetrahydromethanopterin reductase-like flavin-dependent oxidoreductase (luciferase family)
MKFGVIYEIALPISEEAKGRTESEVYWETIEQVVRAEEVGFEYAWFPEHHFLEDLSRSSVPEVFLGALAQHTKTIRLGHGVVLMPPPFNHPFKVAEKIAALDILSHGRVEFGTGRSITMEELGGFGVSPEHARDMMQESIDIIPEIWRHRSFPGYKGRFMDLPARVVVPKPVQKPHPPMWMACTSPSSFKIAGEKGLGCLSFTTNTPRNLTPMLDEYRAALQHAKPPGDFVNDQVAGFTVTYCDSDREAAIQRAGPQTIAHMKRITRYFGQIADQRGYDEYGAQLRERMDMIIEEVDPLEKARELIDGAGLCIGDPETIIRSVEEYERLGFDQFMCMVQFSDITHQESLRSIEMLGEEVIPRFREGL